MLIKLFREYTLISTENLESLRDELIYNIQTLRLLGKFVGLIEFLPYQNEEQLPDHIMRSQINIRNKVIFSCISLKVLPNISFGEREGGREVGRERERERGRDKIERGDGEKRKRETK